MMEEHKEPAKPEAKPDPLEQPETQQETEEYSFLQETIKDEAGSAGKRKKTILKTLGLGLLFGLAASFSFCVFKPWYENTFQKNTAKVTIPKEEDPEGTAEGNGQTEGAEAEGNEQEVPSVVLDAANYRQLNQALNAVAQEAAKSVVEITGITGGQDWVDASYDKANSVSGLIIFDNGQNILIYGKTSILKDSNEIRATFYDGKTYNAVLKKRDANLGFGIYAVAKNELSEGTLAQMQAATLGSSNSAAKGETAIVLGKPFGYAAGMGFGVISSSRNVVERADGQYKLLCTDIAGTRDGTGVIVNLRGEVIGIVDQTLSDQDSMNLVTAYGISDLKAQIELLSQEKGVPYMGIRGVDVTDAIAQQGLPKGVYVREVETDSPAMAAGIQVGDIITSVGGTEVATLVGYSNVLIEETVGSKMKVKGQRQGAGGGYIDIDFTVTVGSKE